MAGDVEGFHAAVGRDDVDVPVEILILGGEGNPLAIGRPIEGWRVPAGEKDPLILAIGIRHGEVATSDDISQLPAIGTEREVPFRGRRKRDLLGLERLRPPPELVRVFAGESPDLAFDPVVLGVIDVFSVRREHRVVLHRLRARHAVGFAKDGVHGPEFTLGLENDFQSARRKVGVHRAIDLPHLLTDIGKVFRLPDVEPGRFSSRFRAVDPEIEAPPEGEGRSVRRKGGEHNPIVLEMGELAIFGSIHPAAPEVESAILLGNVVETLAVDPG